MKRHWKQLTLMALGIGVLLLWGNHVSGETATAPLNGTVSFQATSAPADTLNVDSGSKTVKATDATKIQGSPNSRITVVTAEGSGTVHVADVILRDGDSLYRVTGTYGGGGGGPAIWNADYNRGGARILLEVNQTGNTDNVILPGAKGATLTVTLAGVSAGNYSVTLSKDSGSGTVTFPTNPVTFTGAGSKTVDLTGGTSGNVTIKGTCTGLTDGTVDAVVSSLAVDKVTFGAVTGAIHDVALDATGAAYPTPHWKRNRATQSPTCYERAAKMKVTVKFTAATGVTGSVKVRGSGSGFSFASTDAPVSSGTVTVSDWAADKAFANTVDIFDPMDLLWEVSVDGGTTWTSGGTSSNQTYITLGSPATTTIYHTLAQIGCQNAKGQNAEAQTIVKVWGAFTGRDVRRIDGTRLTYYADYTTTNVTTASLLTNGDGQCGAWAKLFLDMLKVQGIDQANEYIIFQPMNSSGFLVKNWNIPAAGGISGVPGYPFLNVQDNPLVGKTSYNFKYAQVTDQAGIPGQGTANPASLFGNHQIVKLDGIYYDPSYGVTYANFAAIKGAAIDGFILVGQLAVNEAAVNLDLNGDGDKVDTVNQPCVVSTGTAGDTLSETAVNY